MRTKLIVATIWITVFVTAALLGFLEGAANPGPRMLALAPSPAVPPDPTPANIQCVDDSNFRVQILTPQIEIVTKYGTLTIPFQQINRIRFATRLSADTQLKIDRLIHDLGHDDFTVRTKADNELFALRAHAYHPLLRIGKDSRSPEVVHRAAITAERIRITAPHAGLDYRDHDTVYAANCEVFGMLSGTVLSVRTSQFGDQPLHYESIANILLDNKTGSFTPQPAPVNLNGYARQFGKEFTFVIPAVTMITPGSIWGTGPYSLDSNIAGAAAHAGFLKPGGALPVTVRIRIIESPAQFTGSTANGVATLPFAAAYPNGAFEFLTVGLGR